MPKVKLLQRNCEIYEKKKFCTTNLISLDSCFQRWWLSHLLECFFLNVTFYIPVRHSYTAILCVFILSNTIDFPVWKITLKNSVFHPQLYLLSLITHFSTIMHNLKSPKVVIISCIYANVILRWVILDFIRFKNCSIILSWFAYGHYIHSKIPLWEVEISK